MSLKYSFILPYHKRAEQLTCTLTSFMELYQDRDDYEVIIIEDMKNWQDPSEHAALVRVIASFPNIFFTHVIRTDESWNPAPAFNQGAKVARGQYLVISNPECVHKTNILEGLDHAFTQDPDCYVVCACLSVQEFNLSPKEVQTKPGVWFQHSVHRNILCYFCSVISRENYGQIEGFDEGYNRGMCFDDDDFRNTVVAAGIPIIARDDLIVVHLNHNKSKPKNYFELHQINKAYYESKWGQAAQKAETIFPTVRGVI